ncbi:MAG: NFACT family protein [Paenibacillaceae bacterium]|nr:NFACT family protein [Paenibacillaceae bacterium]
MSIDAAVIRALVHAYTPLIGAHITKIQMPSAHEIHFSLRHETGNDKYALSVHPDAPFLLPIHTKCTYPEVPYAFCMLLRKHCAHGIITDIHQPHMERIVHIDIVSRQPWDDVGTDVRLVVEWMGKHSNIIVVRGDTVLDACRRITISRYRTLVPGARYVPAPSMRRTDPLTTDGDTFAAWVQTTDDPTKDIVAHYDGMSPICAKEIVHRARTDGWVAAWTSIIAPIKAHAYTPTITHARTPIVTVYTPTHIDAPHTSVAHIVDALRACIHERTPLRSTPALHSWVRQERAKKEKKRVHLQEAIDSALNAHTYRTYGTLIYTHMHAITEGMTELTVHTETDTVTIPLDASLSPAQNAAKHFQTYKKLHGSTQMRQEQYDACIGDIEHLETIAHQLTDATEDDIDAIIAELHDCGYDIRQLQPKNKTPRKTQKKPTRVGYVSRSGIPIYYGRNNRQNDELTHKFAKATDVWLHARHIAGAHVIVRLPAGMRIDDATLLDAAHVAVWHSAARMSSNVSVDVTTVQHVKKRPSGKPGQVLYEHYKTIVVTPDRERIARLTRI